jgi:hypothetical protein
MDSRVMSASLASMLIGFAAAALAQTSPGSSGQPAAGASFTHGESKRCETLSGTAKEQCDKEEANNAAPASSPSPRDSASSGSSAGASVGPRFTHGESKRCESMTGAAKEQCDKQEATK